jgi:hypothetical protein
VVQENHRETPTWAYYPLYAFWIIVLAPLIFAPWLDGDLGSLLIILALGVFNVLFIVLYFIVDFKAKKEWPETSSVRRAMWGSIIGMCIANIVFMVYLALTFRGPLIDLIGSNRSWFSRKVDDLVGFIAILSPLIFGPIGWFIGRRLKGSR